MPIGRTLIVASEKIEETGKDLQNLVLKNPAVNTFVIGASCTGKSHLLSKSLRESDMLRKEDVLINYSIITNETGISSIEYTSPQDFLLQNLFDLIFEIKHGFQPKRMIVAIDEIEMTQGPQWFTKTMRILKENKAELIDKGVSKIKLLDQSHYRDLINQALSSIGCVVGIRTIVPAWEKEMMQIERDWIKSQLPKADLVGPTTILQMPETTIDEAVETVYNHSMEMARIQNRDYPERSLRSSVSDSLTSLAAKSRIEQLLLGKPNNKTFVTDAIKRDLHLHSARAGQVLLDSRRFLPDQEVGLQRLTKEASRLSNSEGSGLAAEFK